MSKPLHPTVWRRIASRYTNELNPHTIFMRSNSKYIWDASDTKEVDVSNWLFHWKHANGKSYLATLDAVQNGYEHVFDTLYVIVVNNRHAHNRVIKFDLKEDRDVFWHKIPNKHECVKGEAPLDGETVGDITCENDDVIKPNEISESITFNRFD